MLNRKQAPEFHPIRVPSLKKPESQIFGNGAELAMFLDKSQNMVSVDFIFPANQFFSSGRQTDAYSYKMLLEGTTTRDSKKIADDISFLGATIDIIHSAESDTISISCLSRFLPKALDIVKSIWSESIFPAREWKVIVETSYQQNLISLKKTSNVAGRILRQGLFGTNLDYGYSFDMGFVESLSADDLKRHFQNLQNIGPRLTLVAGWAEEEALNDLIDWISSFKSVGKLSETPGLVFPKNLELKNWIDMDDSQQTSLRIGQHSIDNHHPASPIFSLVMEIFGGYFGSRLMANIREEKGWTYGIFAQRVPNRYAPYWLISSDLNGESALLALDEIQKEAKLLKSELVSPEELEKVKNYMVGQFLTTITNCFTVADRYRSAWLLGINFDQITANLNVIKSATQDQVLEIAKEFLNVEEGIVVCAGYKSKA